MSIPHAKPSDWNLATGFRLAGVVSKLRSEPNRRDLAVILTDGPASAGAVFTQNQVCAAPVIVSRARVPADDIRGLVVCSGNANACTGEQGLRDAERMAAIVAERIDCEPRQILVASTGVIGRPLPMGVLEAGIPEAVSRAATGAEALNDAAHAILTTDTKIKVSTRRVGAYSVTGFGKGAAMVGPNMATMLGFILTDAPLNAKQCQDIVRRGTQNSFNCISVEGHTSTNDAVFLLASGQGATLDADTAHQLETAVHDVCSDLARMIAEDAEGASHLITIDVEGCRSDGEARQVAKTVADSALVKTAIFGADPNWGRIVSAAGYSGVKFAETELSLWMGDMPLYKNGVPLPFDEATASQYLRDNREVHLRLRFNLGPGRCTFYTCDLTYEYVRLNAEYTT